MAVYHRRCRRRRRRGVYCYLAGPPISCCLIERKKLIFLCAFCLLTYLFIHLPTYLFTYLPTPVCERMAAHSNM